MFSGGIPVEMISGLGGMLLGGVLKLMSLSAHNKQMQTQLLMAQVTKEQDGFRSAREGPKRGWQGFAWTRRTIALTTVFSVILLPKIAALMDNPPQVIYAWAEHTSGFLFFPGHTVQHWTMMNGIVITPVDIHMTLAVAGVYLGASIVGNVK